MNKAEKKAIQEEIDRLKDKLRQIDDASRSILGRNLVYWRKEREMTQEDLAECVKISRPMLSNIERGTNDTSIRNLMELCKALSVTPNDLLLERK